MANARIVVSIFDVDSEDRSISVAAFSSALKAKAWAYGQTKDADVVEAFEVVIDGTDTGGLSGSYFIALTNKLSSKQQTTTGTILVRGDTDLPHGEEF